MTTPVGTSITRSEESLYHPDQRGGPSVAVMGACSWGRPVGAEADARVSLESAETADVTRYRIAFPFLVGDDIANGIGFDRSLETFERQLAWLAQGGGTAAAEFEASATAPEAEAADTLRPPDDVEFAPTAVEAVPGDLEDDCPERIEYPDEAELKQGVRRAVPRSRPLETASVPVTHSVRFSSSTVGSGTKNGLQLLFYY